MAAISTSPPIASYTSAREPTPQQTPLWQQLIPVISVIAIGIICSPVFKIGAITGAVTLSITVLSLGLLVSLGLLKKTDGGAYLEKIRKMPACATAVFIPILEEAIFRGGLQRGLTELGKQVLTHKVWQLPLGVYLSTASLVAIVATSVLFGAVHALNDHEGASQQAFITGFHGFVMGVLAANYGILASIGAHIINNTLAVTAIKSSSEASPYLPSPNDIP